MSSSNVSTLIYPSLSGVDLSVYTNVLLIDSVVQDYQTFVTSANAQTFPVVYSSNSSRDELLALLTSARFSNLSRIGLVFVTAGSLIPTFLNSEPLFSVNESVPYSNNAQIILNLISNLGIKNIDYLACNTLNSTHWVNYYALLSAETGVVVGASNDQTGNIKYGGDWVLESTSTDVEMVYFTSSIEYYTYLLDTGANTFVNISGTIYSTGNNNYGQLGIGNTSNKTTLTALTSFPAGKTVSAIARSYSHTIVLMTDGTVYGCGSNAVGQLGNGTSGNQSTTLTSMTLPVGKTAVAVSCGASSTTNGLTIVIMNDGTVYGTGYNLYGQLGIGNTTNKNTLTQMTSFPSGKIAIRVSCGINNCIILMSDGTLWGTGDNTYGQIGNGTSGNSYTTLTQMTSIPSGKLATSIATGENYTIVLLNDGTVYGTGYNGLGSLGIGNTTTPITSLTKMVNLPVGKTVKSMGCGTIHTMLLMTDGTVYGTGWNGDGAFGLNHTINPYTTIQAMIMVSGKTATAMACGNSHVNVFMTDGTIYSTGDNSTGQLGTGNNTRATTLTQMTIGNGSTLVTGVTNVLSVSVPVTISVSSGKVACVLEGTEVWTDKGMVAIENLKVGDSIRTRHYKIAVTKIGKWTIDLNTEQDRDDLSKKMYKIAAGKYGTERDVYISHYHRVLVDENPDSDEESRVFRLPTSLGLPVADPREYSKDGKYTLYHLQLAVGNHYVVNGDCMVESWKSSDKYF